MTDFAPTNYAALQPQYNVAQTFANGFSIGDAIRQRQLENAKIEEQQRIAKQMQEDVTGVANNPNATADDYAALSTKYPQFADKFKQAYEMIDGKEKDAKVNLYGNAYAAISNGNTDLATKLIQDQADAYKNSGDAKKAQDYQFAADIIKNNPSQAKFMAGMFLSQAMGADKFVQTFGALNDENRKQEAAPIELQKKQADLNKANADATTAQAQADVAVPKTQAELDKAQADAKTAQETAKNAPQKQQLDLEHTQAETNALNNKPAADQAKEALKTDPFGIKDVLDTGLSGQALLNQLPAGLASQVKALAEGKMAFPSGRGLGSDKVQQLLQAVGQYDPTFDAVNYNARVKTRASFTSGKDAETITALNTAIGHLGTLQEAYDKLNNTRFPLVNNVVNTIGEATGNSDIQANAKKVESTSLAVAHELAKVFRSTGMSEGEIKDWQKLISKNASPDQSKAVIDQAIELMNSRLNALGEKYNQGMGTTKDPLELLSPKSQKILSNLTGEPIAKSTTPAQATMPKLQTSPAILAKAKQLGWDDATLQQFLRDHAK